MSTTVKMTLIETVQAARVMREVYRSSRCACGCGGTWDRTVSGTIGGFPAVWMSCRYNSGSSVGGGLTGDSYYIALAVSRAADHHGHTPQEIVETEVVDDGGTMRLQGAAEREVDTAHWEAVSRRKAEREARKAELRAEYERTRPERDAKAAAEKAVMDAQRAEWFAKVKPDYDAAYAAARTKRDRELIVYWKQQSVSGYDSDRDQAAKQLRRIAAAGCSAQEPVK